VTVTGIVRSCERQQQALSKALPDAIVMIGGYCHYHTGAVLDVHDGYINAKRSPRRLTGEAAREAYGDIVFAPADWPRLAQLRSVGEQFRSAVRKSDRIGLMKMHGLPRQWREEQDEMLLAALTAKGDSQFAQLGAGPPSPMAVFIDRREWEESNRGDATDRQSGIICFCKTRDCDDRWPISRMDADNKPSRPYVCTEVSSFSDTGTQFLLDTPVGDGRGLAEPSFN
jgi:hypothetical protein